MKRTIEVNYEEGEGLDRYELKGTVVMKRLNFSEKNSVEEESTEIKMYGSSPQVSVSTKKIKELGLFKSISECDLVKTTYIQDKVTKAIVPQAVPYLLDLQGIQNLPNDVGETLLESFTDLNKVDEKKK